MNTLTPKTNHKRIDLNRITDKVVLMVSIFIFVLTALAVTLISQNRSTRQVLADIRELRIPVPITTADIISGANRVAASQRAYLMTGQEKYKQERLDVWNDQINAAAEKLKKLRERMRLDEHKAAVDAALSKLSAYEKTQNDIDVFFEKELKGLSTDATKVDSLGTPAFIAAVQKRNQLDAELDAMVTGEASILRTELRNVLMPLNNAQEELLMQDNANVESNIATSNATLILVSGASILSILVLAIFLTRSLKKSIRKPTGLLDVLSRGELPENGQTSQDELNEIIQAANTLSENMKKASTFALEIGDGKFEHDFVPASEKDLLGNSLIQMRDRLKKVAEEDRKNNWANTGLAELGNILRKDTDNEEQLYNDIVAYVVKYLGANQGALFMVEEEAKEKVLKLAACYAYGRKKFIKESFNAGEGLIGQVYLERQHILMKEVPQDFVKITSGLGEATPRCVMTTPLIANEECYGVFEVASFNVLEDYQVNFVDRICEQIAAALSKVQINAKTRRLLQDSQQQAEELRTQEEEMRQSMEELTATQEEMARKDAEMTGQLTAINNTMATIEFNLDGSIIAANDKFLNGMGYTQDEIKNKHHRMFVDTDYAQSDAYDKFWHNLKNGIAQVGEFKRRGARGKEVWISASYTPILNREGVPYKVIKFAQDITEQKMKSIDYEGQVEAIRKSNAVIEFDLSGKILDANQIFVEAMGYKTKEQIAGKHHRIFVGEDDQQSAEYKMFWNRLATGEFFTGEFKRKKYDGTDIWIEGSYNPIFDTNGKPFKVVKFARAIDKGNMVNGKL
jgi:PAS domain S-box-containing protein